jgi:hypothetical protein
MSDIHPHSRPDIDFLPCDCEMEHHLNEIPQSGLVRLARPPALNEDGATVGAQHAARHPCSFYLTLKPRSLVQAVRDVSKVRDLEPWVWDLLAPKRDNLISLASERAKRRKG